LLFGDEVGRTVKEEDHMAWDRRGYYRRNRKVNGRVVTEYCGGGLLGQLCAEADAINKTRREAERRAHRDMVDRLAPVDTDHKADQRIFDAWQTQQYRSYSDLARELGRKEWEVQMAIDRQRKRIERRGK
jgi:hypothetical protein